MCESCIAGPDSLTIFRLSSIVDRTFTMLSGYIQDLFPFRGPVTPPSINQSATSQNIGWGAGLSVSYVANNAPCPKGTTCTEVVVVTGSGAFTIADIGSYLDQRAAELDADNADLLLAVGALGATALLSPELFGLTEPAPVAVSPPPAAAPPPATPPSVSIPYSPPSPLAGTTSGTGVPPGLPPNPYKPPEAAGILQDLADWLDLVFKL